MAYTRSFDITPVEKMLVEIQHLNGTVIEYGYFGKTYPGGDPYKRGGLDVAEMAITHEYGDPTGRPMLPARPFMSESFHNYVVPRFNSTFETAFSGVMLGGSYKGVVSTTTAILKTAIPFTIGSASFVPLSAATMERRAELGISGSQPLDATGVLKNSSQVRVNGTIV